MALYLLANKLTAAKFLWGRAPDALKVEGSQLDCVWNVGIAMWEGEHGKVYSLIDSGSKSPSSVTNLMALVKEAYQERTLAMIASAYADISLTDCARLLGVDENMALTVCTKMGWKR